MHSIFVLVGLIAGLLTFVGVAQAEPENPIVRGSLEVQVVGGGKVTGTGIDCGTDCSHTAAWRENEIPPKNRLTGTANTGWAFSSWTGCTPVVGQPTRCDAGYGTEDPYEVTARFVDVQAPNIYISFASPGHKAGDSLLVGAEASDNDRVTRVEFLIDGQVMATDAQAPWSAELDTRGIAEGNHQLQARAFDPAGNQTSTANWQMAIDHTGPEVELNSPVAATNASSPQFSFSSSSADFWGAECAIQKQGETDEMIPCGRDDWYSEAAPTEGAWEFVVRVFDDASNATVVKHTFVVDRTAPVTAFTSGPADGSVVEVGDVKYAWSVTDGLPVTQECSWDNGEAVACDGTASRGLTAGAHSFKVVATDQAGNDSTLTRTFSVKKDGTIPPPDPDPDTTDKTAPVVKLVAPKQRLKAVRKALKLNVRCNEACSGKVVVKGKGGMKFAGRVSMAKAGVAKLKLRPTAKSRKRLKALVKRNGNQAKPRPLKLTAKANLKDNAGNQIKANLKFKVKG